MGRTFKPGISFYRMDGGHIINKKVRLLINEFDSDGYYIWMCFIDYAYKEWGYYFDTRDKDIFELFASEYCRKKVSTVKEVMNGCIRRGLFDKNVFDSFGILTSEMMQETFLIATAERRNKGSVFEMQRDWLLLETSQAIPQNIMIVPLNNEIVPPNNSTDKNRIEEKKLEEKKVIGAAEPPTPTPAVVVERKKREVFSKPSLDDVKNYFAETIGNPKNHDYWPPDRCQIEACSFFNHYTANGWVQGRGKPLKDWQAAVRNWILNAKKGSFSAPQPAAGQQQKTVPQQQTRNEPALPQLTKMQQEINYLYERFLEDKCTVVSIEHLQYNYLKQIGAINFSEVTINQIKQDALKHLKEKNIDNPNEQILVTAMKKFGVLEFFKQMQAAGRNEIFTL